MSCARVIGEAHHVSTDGTFSWIEVECLGACVNAPMVQINADYYEDLTPETLTRILNDLAAGKTPKPGPQINREFSAPVGGPLTLTDPSLSREEAGRSRERPRGGRSQTCRSPTPPTRDATDARRQGSHFQESLRPARLGPCRRTRAGRLGRQQSDPGERPRRYHRRDEGLGSARPRRRRVPDRAQMVVHAQAAGGGEAALSRRQRRQVGARHVQGSRDHAARSASPRGGLPHCRLRHGRSHLLHLHPRRIHPRARAAGGGRGAGL